MKSDDSMKLRITRISSQRNWRDLRLKEVWQYRDLILIITKRGFQLTYKQTVLGPLWLILRPFITSVVYSIVFGHIAGIQTAGVPGLLFYLASTGIWNFFSACVTGNASVFTANAYLFGKVYFPRLTVPVSQVLSALIQFAIQAIMVLLLLVYYTVKGILHPVLWTWIFIPPILLILGIMGMGTGIIISSMTTKYRDLSILVGFGMNLWMFCTPVVYPLSEVPMGWLHTLVQANPVTPLIELYRHILLGEGKIIPVACLWSFFFTLIVAFAGMLIFNRVERTFMDTV